ncbi:MAG TPA: RNA 2',3'-cyclic phosphodiesterase [Kiritimatiellia bacterium]|nr:RNA 2',3'-cyclic phosphodiesterase [Kiritimatiellia bacterium]
MPKPPETHRLFIGLLLPASVQKAAARIQERLAATGAPLRLPCPSDLHLTLLFLGSTPASLLPDLARALDQASSAIPPFSLTFSGIGTFGPPRRPRVIWTGIPHPPRPLLDLHDRSRQAVLALGHPLEDRPFQPHLTLARPRPPQPWPALTTTLASLTNQLLGSVEVREVHLLRSQPHLTTHRYTTLHTASLKGTPHHGQG